MSKDDDHPKEFERFELHPLMSRALYWAQNIPNPHWKAAYAQLASALDHLDAMIARSSNVEGAMGLFGTHDDPADWWK